jgi:hypothetical protein
MASVAAPASCSELLDWWWPLEVLISSRRSQDLALHENTHSGKIAETTPTGRNTRRPGN